MNTPTLIQSLMIADEIRNRFAILAAKNRDRLEDAAEIAATPGSITGCELEGYTVTSQRDPSKSYRVSLNAHTCTCPDHLAHGNQGNVCKHRLSCYILQLYEEREEAANQPEAQPLYVGQVFNCLRTAGSRNSMTPDRWSCIVTHLTNSENGDLTYITLQSPFPVFVAPGCWIRTHERTFRIPEFFNNKFFRVLSA